MIDEPDFNNLFAGTPPTSTAENSTLSYDDLLTASKKLQQLADEPVRELFEKLGGNFDKQILILPERYKGYAPDHKSIMFNQFINAKQGYFITKKFLASTNLDMPKTIDYPLTSVK